MMVQPLNFFTPISCCKDLWTSYFGPVAFSFSCRMQSLWTKLLRVSVKEGPSMGPGSAGNRPVILGV